MPTNAVGRGLRLPTIHLTGTVTASKAWTPSAAMAAAMTVHHNVWSGSSKAFASSCSSSSSIFVPATRRNLHSSSRTDIQSSQRRTNTLTEPLDVMTMPHLESARAPLSVLPLSTVVRSLMTNAVSSSPTFLPPSLRIMGMLAHTHNPLFNPDVNPVLRFALKKTFYAQFCAGENSPEIRSTIDGLKKIGFSGVILNYAKEVVLSEAEAKQLANTNVGEETEAAILNEINPWAAGTLQTIRLASPGDFVAMKFTGAGRLALHLLKNRLATSPRLTECIEEICALAEQRNIRLLFDAEQDALQDGIDDWTMHFARKYNKEKVVIFGTYQAYKKCCPEVITNHLAMAQKEGFHLGVKLVRGAYLGSDPRHRLHDTKEDTDACFEEISAAVLTQQWTNSVKGEGRFPPSSLVLATHNAESVRRARAICDAGAAKTPVAFAQLQGMADEVSCELVEANTQSSAATQLPTFKYVVWGSTGECMKYLLRRAHENKDAISRTKSGRDAMWAELVRRCKVAVGLAA